MSRKNTALSGVLRDKIEIILNVRVFVLNNLLIDQAS